MFSPPLVGLGAVPLAYLFLIGRRLSAYLDDERIRYHGWLRTAEAEWRHIASVTPADGLPYPRSRYYGPSSYEVKTAVGRFVVNLLYFPPEFARAFIDVAKRHNLMRHAV
jgi:hypothetical protein